MASTLAAEPTTGTTTTFVPAEVLAQAGTMNKPQADLCGFGCVQVDDAGRVLVYNRYMSEMSGVSSGSAAGKNYFTQVNPCANNPMFYGQFKRGVSTEALDQVFEYLFTHQMRPTTVTVHMYRDGLSKTNWLFIRKV
jgi:photoactive yellow protein